MKDLKITRDDVYKINLKLSKSSLVIQNFGNASARSANGFVIKPSGIDLEMYSPKDMVEMDLSGKVINGSLKPSSDEPTHRILYSENKEINGIVHTHSKFATAFAQANIQIENFGTTHSDFSKFPIFVTDQLSENQVEIDYEKNTGIKILEKLKDEKVNIMETPGILSIRHGVFSWGETITQALDNAEIIEYIAEICILTKTLNPNSETIEKFIAKKHFDRKHGPNKYYGQ